MRLLQAVMPSIKKIHFETYLVNVHSLMIKMCKIPFSMEYKNENDITIDYTKYVQITDKDQSKRIS